MSGPSSPATPLLYVIEFDCESCGEEALWVRRAAWEGQDPDGGWICNDCREVAK